MFIPEKLSPFTHKASVIKKVPWVDIAVIISATALITIGMLAHFHVIHSIGHLSNAAIQYLAFGGAGGISLLDIATHILKKCLKSKKQARAARDDFYIFTPREESYGFMWRKKASKVTLRSPLLKTFKDQFYRYLFLSKAEANETKMDFAKRVLDMVLKDRNFTGEVTIQIEDLSITYNYVNGKSR